MKILHVEDYFDPHAGYQINEILMSKSLDDEIYLICSKDMTPFHKKYQKKNDKDFETKYKIKIIRMNKLIKISSRILYFNLFKKIDSIKPDLVFLHGIGDFKDLILFRRKRKYKIVRDCHMSWVASKNKYSRLYFKLYKIIFARKINNSMIYSKIFALGFEEKHYLEKLGIHKHNIEMLFHGYSDDSMFFSDTERNKLRTHYNINDKNTLISYIGKFDFYKRPDLIIDMTKILIERNNNINVSLLFLGSKDEQYMKYFTNKINLLENTVQLIVEDSFKFIDLYKAYSASDICIFPKQTTLSSIHAQVCGCKVVMEKHESNLERVLDSENLYDIDNITQAVNILENLINKKDFSDREKYKEKLYFREYSNQINKIKRVILKG